MDEVLYACRFFQFTAAMVIFGALAFRLYAVPGDDARTAPSVLADALVHRGMANPATSSPLAFGSADWCQWDGSSDGHERRRMMPASS